MEDLLRQIDAAAGSRVYYLALIGSLTVPDVAGALSSPSGEASANMYRKWVRANLPWWAQEGRDELLYQYRNTMLHQHSGQPDPRKKMPRLMFVEPNDSLHIHNSTVTSGESSALIIDVRMFCREVTDAARSWQAATLTDATVLRNLVRSVRRHPGGLRPFIEGFPVIA